MSFNHPISDMLTRIRNGQNAGKDTVSMPHSKLRVNVLEVMKDEGYIDGFAVEELAGNKKDIVVDLKYVGGEGAIQEISVVSKPGRRVYSGSAKMPKVMNGLGVSIVSTPNGIMTDHKARQQNVGGEVLCRLV